MRIYIPQTMRPGAVLLHTIGSEACCRLIAKSASERIYIPKDGCLSAKKRSWRTDVVTLHAKGFSAAGIARRLGWSERLVYKIVARNR